MAKITCECFWCGNDTGKTVECSGDDRKAITSYKPCAKCKESFDQGVFFFEVLDKPLCEKQPSITLGDGKQYYPSSRHAVVDEGEVKKRFPKQAKHLLSDKRAPVSQEVFNELFGDEELQSS